MDSAASQQDLQEDSASRRARTVINRRDTTNEQRQNARLTPETGTTPKGQYPAEDSPSGRTFRTVTHRHDPTVEQRRAARLAREAAMFAKEPLDSADAGAKSRLASDFNGLLIRTFFISPM